MGKVYSRWFFALFAVCFSLMLQASDYDKLFHEAGKCFEQYNQALKDWYPAYLHEDDAYMKKRLGDRQYDGYLNDQQQLEELTAKIQTLFSEFKEHVRDIVFARYHGATPFACEELNPHMLNMIYWYINFMENLIFPDDWRLKFEAYKQAQLCKCDKS